MSVQLELRYHVPGSQVWPNSRGGHRGNVHLHVLDDVQLGRRRRRAGECLCSKRHGSYERPPEQDEVENGYRCDECWSVAAKHQYALILPPDCRDSEPEAAQATRETGRC